MPEYQHIPKVLQILLPTKERYKVVNAATDNPPYRTLESANSCTNIEFDAKTHLDESKHILPRPRSRPRLGPRLGATIIKCMN